MQESPNALVLAAAYGTAADVQLLLARFGHETIDACMTPLGMNAMHVAAARGDNAMIDALVEAGTCLQRGCGEAAACILVCWSFCCCSEWGVVAVNGVLLSSVVCACLRARVHASEIGVCLLELQLCTAVTVTTPFDLRLPVGAQVHVAAEANGETPFLVAARYGHTDVLLRLLSEYESLGTVEAALTSHDSAKGEEQLFRRRT